MENRQRNTRFLYFSALGLSAFLPMQVAHAGGQASFPSDADIQSAQQHSRSVLKSLPDMGTVQRQFGSVGLPQIGNIPAPRPTPKTDIAELARHFQTATQPQLSSRPAYDLLIMASLSMPKEALHRLAQQAQRAHATFVFRGLSGNSMMQMSRDVRNALGGISVPIIINPPAFKQFNVSRVPAFVIATHQAGNVLESGCSNPQTYVKVSGDVSLDYALDYIGRKSQRWGNVAESFRSRIVRGVN